MSNDLNLSLTGLGDLNDIAKVSNATVDLNFVLEELLKGGDVENLVGCGLRSVDDVLLLDQSYSNQLFTSQYQTN